MGNRVRGAHAPFWTVGSKDTWTVEMEKSIRACVEPVGAWLIQKFWWNLVEISAVRHSRGIHCVHIRSWNFIL